MSSRLESRRRGRPRGSDTRQLLTIARQEFLALGYAGATMDAVAAKARISKQSLYRQFASKELLFAAVVKDWVDQGRDAMRPHSEALREHTDIRGRLLRLARSLQAGVLSTPVIQMRALVAAEAPRFPEVASDYVTRSWNGNQLMLAEAFTALGERGDLVMPDPLLAAEQFTWLALAAPLNRLTLEGAGNRYPESQLETIAVEAVETFLSRFGRGGHTGSQLP
ncbi:TetR/AcrR family transcriptional regulator [Okibacterium endophyticum]